MGNRSSAGAYKSADAIIVMLFLLGCFGFIAVLILDVPYWGREILAEGRPTFSFKYIARSIIIFASVAIMLWSVTGSGKPRIGLTVRGGVLPLELFAIMGVLMISAIVLFLFVVKPSEFSVLSLEDDIVEWGSAILLFASCLVMARASIKSFGSLNLTKSFRSVIVFFSFVFFVIAMEEVSWFQRVFGFETPRILAANIQKEMNLHNLYTNQVENIYYFGAFLFLSVLPFIRSLYPCVFGSGSLSIFVPRPFIVVIGAIICAYNFDMWDIVFTQIAFFSSVFILFAFFVYSNDRYEQVIIFLTILLVVSSQLIFITNPSNYSRLWEITEYKEFFISLGFFMYSVDVFVHIKRAQLLETA